MDPLDLLFTNEYIANPELTKDIESKRNEEFRIFIEEENERKRIDKISKNLNDMSLREPENDLNDIQNTNTFIIGKKDETLSAKRLKKEVVTYINIDSRDRNKLMYINANKFRIYLDKSYYNVKSIKLSKMEFPNTNAVINSTNNKIYWRNLNDIETDQYDTVTKNYPVYSTELRIGSYIAATLQSEMETKMGEVRRKDTNDFHYFLVNLNIETDVVDFTSLSLRQLGNNTIETLVGTNIVRIFANAHGFVTGDEIYLVGTKLLAGIGSDVLNGAHTITSVNPNDFFFEVTVNASDSLVGGGNTIKLGKFAPFQLLFGEYTNTVAPNIGYPFENSSNLIDVNLKDQLILYQLQITLTEKHVLDNSYINQPSKIDETFTLVDGNRIISKILSNKALLVIFSSKIQNPIFTGVFKYNVLINGIVTEVTQNIQSIENYNVDNILITTYASHNYTLNDIGKTITFFNTKTTPPLDGDHILDNVLSNTEFVIANSLLLGGEFTSSEEGDAGTIPLFNPFKTLTYNIRSVTIGNQTLIRTNVNHILKIGDKIRFYNIKTSPSLLEKNRGIYTIISIPSASTFIVDFNTNDIDTNSLETAYIGTNILELTFPNHSFNYITSIVNDTGNRRLITTILDHKLEVNKTIRISDTNSVPSLDNSTTSYTIIEIPSANTFIIETGLALTTNGTFGLLGIESTSFFLYGVETIGNFNADYINSNKFRIRDIIDSDTFRFDAINVFSLETVNGGGNNVYISSVLHGFNGVQQNTKNSLISRSINLEGENYSFLQCPQLNTMKNTGTVKDIFARITLDQSPGGVVFSFLSNPKVFNETPLESLIELDFSVVNYDGTLYEFNDLDYSFVLEITEIVDTTDQFNISSKRGVIDMSSISQVETTENDRHEYN
jgi:hypothetical protein